MSSAVSRQYETRERARHSMAIRWAPFHPWLLEHTKVGLSRSIDQCSIASGWREYNAIQSKGRVGGRIVTTKWKRRGCSQQRLSCCRDALRNQCLDSKYSVIDRFNDDACKRDAMIFFRRSSSRRSEWPVFLHWCRKLSSTLMLV